VDAREAAIRDVIVAFVDVDAAIEHERRAAANAVAAIAKAHEVHGVPLAELAKRVGRDRSNIAHRYRPRRKR
jgi:hypothetical protein